MHHKCNEWTCALVPTHPHRFSRIMLRTFLRIHMLTFDHFGTGWQTRLVIKPFKWVHGLAGYTATHDMLYVYPPDYKL